MVSGPTVPGAAWVGKATMVRSRPDRNTPKPEVNLLSRPLAANSRPSERTPVFTAASSTTSAIIEEMMM